MSGIEDRIDRLLGSDELDVVEFGFLEREGEVAFDALRMRIGGLESRELVRALTMLLRLTRQFSFRKLPDAVRIALTYAESADPVVRSAAVGVAVAGLRVIPRYLNLPVTQPPAPTLEDARPTLVRALQLGVDERVRDDAERFLSGRQTDNPPE
ncbi:MAG TPA: hypothetical protein VLT33_39985 [Labilithrix sp.]|nr:hypothetical protein [Labilithrix sp.]